MNELQLALVGDSVGAPPAHILEGLEETDVHTRVNGAPHTIYEELWHCAFWQQISLNWINGLLSPYPEHNSDTFPAGRAGAGETWPTLSERFLAGAARSAAIAGDPAELDRSVACTSRPGSPLRVKSVRELLEGTAPTTSTTWAGWSCCGSCWGSGLRRRAARPGRST